MTEIRYTISGDYNEVNSQEIYNKSVIYAYISGQLPMAVDFQYSFFAAHVGNSGYVLQAQNQQYIYANDAGVMIDTSDLTTNITVGGSNFGDMLRSGSGADLLSGGAGNDILEGSVGADSIDGGLGTNTVSYEHSGLGVHIDLNLLVQSGSGDENGDVISDVSNVIGSSADDFLRGDGLANTLTGNGGSDVLFGMDGNDRLLITETPIMIDGGAGKDFLIVTGGGAVSLTEEAFTGIEAVYVRNDTRLDMSLVENGSKIVSQSTAGYAVSIVGTAGNDSIIGGKAFDSLDGGAGNDRIVVGNGGADIFGGTGSDKLFGGDGSDTFNFDGDFGRDNVYEFDTALDHFNVSLLVGTFEEVEIKSFHGGQGTLITLLGEFDHTYKIILHDVAASTLTSDNFLFS